MPCALTSNITLDCRDGKGGISEVYFVEQGNVTESTFASGMLTVFSASTSVRHYELDIEQQNNFIENWQASRANGSIFFEGNLSIQLNKGQAAYRNEILLLAQNRLVAFIKDNNDKYWYVGDEFGLMLDPSSWQTGQAMGDLNGYLLKFRGQEKQPAYEVSAAVVAALALV